MFDITIKGCGLTRNYKFAESEIHDEFYVSSIDKFYNEMIELKLIKELSANEFIEFIRKLECSYLRGTK